MPANQGRRNSLRGAVKLIALLATGVLGWAAYAPVETCSDPACARERFRIFVEVDSFGDIDVYVPMQFSPSLQRGLRLLSTVARMTDTATLAQGPPIGTDTTGQGQEGAACV